MPSPYTSIQSGNFDASDVNTWGQGLGVYPNVAGDLATIVAGHTVIYNVNSATQLGTITINGILKVDRAMNTRLALGDVFINILGGGKLDWGTTGDFIAYPNTAIIEWNPTTDGTAGIIKSSGGYLFACGDPITYGGDFHTRLASNWIAGQTFTIIGDYTTKWRIGQEIVINRNIPWNGAYLTDYFFGTIAGLVLVAGNTQLTINEAAPAVLFNAGAVVANMSRNLIFQKTGAATGVAQTNVNRPYIRAIIPAGIPYAGKECDIRDTEFIGFYTLQYYSSFGRFENIAIRNSFSFSFAVCSSTVLKNAIITSMERVFTDGFSSCNIYNLIAIGISGYGFSYGINPANTINYLYLSNCNYGPNTMIKSYIYNGEIVECLYGVYFCQNSLFQIKAYNNYILFNGFYGTLFDSILGWDSMGNPAPNTYDADIGPGLNAVFRNVKLPQAGFVIYNFGLWNLYLKIACENYNQVAGSHRTIFTTLTSYKDSINLRPGGAATSVQVIPNLNYAEPQYYNLFSWLEYPMTAGSKTRSVYVKGTGWAAFPTATEMYFEAEYYPVGSNVPVIVKSTAVISDNVTWIPFPVTFISEAGSRVTYRFYAIKYQAGALINIDNMLIRTGHPDGDVKGDWADGESLLIAEAPNFPAISNVKQGIVFNDGLVGTFSQTLNILILPLEGRTQNPQTIIGIVEK